MLMLQPGLPTLPMRPCRKTPHDLSSWSAALELQKACEEVCLAGLVCVPTMGVLFALRARQACLFSEARFKEQVSAAHRLPQTSAAQTDCRLA